MSLNDQCGLFGQKTNKKIIHLDPPMLCRRNLVIYRKVKILHLCDINVLRMTRYNSVMFLRTISGN